MGTRLKSGGAETESRGNGIVVIDNSERNHRVINEFRAHGGHVGPPGQGRPIVLLHHRGRRTGNSYVTPATYLAFDGDTRVIYVFASKAGGPTNPAWYHNLIEAGSATVEVGVETFAVSVKEVTGSERDAIFAEQVRRFPNFGEYAEKTAGIRTIPVLELRRV
jgi:deazaflavin-dependent oxidoreductase (nitroreductase family)